jgi:hypothetical protein
MRNDLSRTLPKQLLAADLDEIRHILWGAEILFINKITLYTLSVCRQYDKYKSYP